MNRTPGALARRRKRRGLLLFQLLLVFGFLALAWFSFGRNVLAPRREAAVPERLGTLELVNSVRGAEALAQIRKLHGLDVGLTTAYIAEYASGKERVTVWVGRAESGAAATELTRRMVEGIQREGSAFSNLQRLNIEGQEVFQVDGPGGKHFFYNPWQSSVYDVRSPGEKVVWLTMQVADIRPVLERAIKTF